MKLSDILKGAATVIGTMNPAVGAAIGIVNNFLPEGKKLPETATGKEVEDAVSTLPHDVQASIMKKEIALDIAREEGWTERYEAMCSADGQETRAKNIMLMSWFFGIPYIGIGLAATYSIALGQSTLENSWVFIGAYLAIPMIPIKAYYGILTSEQSNRANSLNKLPASPAKGVMDMFRRQ